MSILHQALNVNNDQELETLVETLDLSDSQYIHFMTALNEDMSVDGLRYILENLTKSFGNGSYEKLVEQFKKKPCARKMKKVEEDTVYDHSWYEVKGGKYPKRTKEGVIVKESYDEPIQVWNLELKKNPYISREEIFKAKEIFFKEICDHADEYPNFKELVKVLQSLLDKGIINDKQYKFCRTNWDDLFGEYDPDVYGDSDITESVIKEDVSKINPKVLDELYDIISDQMGDMYLANYDEVDFDNLLDSVDDFGNDIDGYNPALKKDYALALKAKWEKDNKDFENDYILDLSAGIFEGAAITEAKEVIEEPDTIGEEPVEEKPVSTADPELAKFIDQTEKVVDNTLNPEILKGLSDSVASKIPLATDVEQMNKLGELKTKIDTKLNAASKAPVVEGYEYNPDDEEWFDVGDKVQFKWNVEGKGQVTYEGTVREVEKIGGNRYYNIASYNPETKRVENYFRVDPIGEEMKRIYDEDLDETCSGGCCSAGSVATIGKRLGKKPKKKKIPEAIDTKLFKESIYTDTPAESILEGHTFKYFMNEGKWYLSCDNALVKTFDKDVMIESVDEIINGEEPSCGLLKGYSCYEMNLLMEDISTISADDEIKGISDDVKNPVLFASSKIGNLEDYKKEYDNMTADEKNEKNKLDQDVENNIGNNMDYVDDSSTEPKQVKVLGTKKLDNGAKLAQVQDINSKEVKDVPTTTLKKKVGV